MKLRSVYQTLVRPVNPRAELWIRRISGAGMGVLACLTATFAASLVLDLRKEKAEARLYGTGISDAGGMAHALVIYALVPAIVLLLLGSVAFSRNLTIKWWLPLLVMGVLGGAVAAFLA